MKEQIPFSLQGKCSMVALYHRILKTQVAYPNMWGYMGYEPPYMGIDK